MIELQEAKIILEGETRWVFKLQSSARSGYQSIITSEIFYNPQWWQIFFFSNSQWWQIVFFSIPSGGKYYQKDGGRRGYEPEVFSRIFWEDNEAEEEEEERLEKS